MGKDRVRELENGILVRDNHIADMQNQMEEKQAKLEHYEFYIDVVKKIIKRTFPNFGGDIVTGMRLIEEERTQGKARIRGLEEALENVRGYLKQKETPRHIIDMHVEKALSEKSDKEK